MAKNCIKGCGNVTDKTHCGNPACPWLICVACRVVFNPNNIRQEMKWLGK